MEPEIRNWLQNNYFSLAEPVLKNTDYQNTASGATALIFAASSGREAVVEQLLAAGANPTLTTQEDFTALDLASTRKIRKLIQTC